MIDGNSEALGHIKENVAAQTGRYIALLQPPHIVHTDVKPVCHLFLCQTVVGLQIAKIVAEIIKFKSTGHC